MSNLSNPEQAWVPAKQVTIISRAEVEKCIGPTTEHLSLLAGGQANTNIRIGEEKVLRLYRRDASIAPKELALLQKPWKNLMVPEVLSSGNGFVLTRFLKHYPLEDGAPAGEAIGKALAEIHSQTYPTAGFLSSALQIEEPMDNFVEDMWSYLCSFEENPGPALTEELYDEILEFFDEHMDELQKVVGKPVLLHGDFKVSNLHGTDQAKPLVLDWEFAYAGSALMDIGQLFRWPSSSEFHEAFRQAYVSHGGQLPEGWKRWAEILDLINLVGLLQKAVPGSPRALDVTQKIEATLSKN